MNGDLLQARSARVAQMGLTIGSRVRFSRDFLRDTGQVTGSITVARGEIVSFTDWSVYRLATVHWFDGSDTNVAEGNLARDDGVRETETTEWSVARNL